MGTLQPPLVLQLFLPLQPWSPDPQPPWLAHSFLPAQVWWEAVAQPPLFLQLFLPAQPWSPDSQPPLLAQPLSLAQACLSEALLGWVVDTASGEPAQPKVLPINRPVTAVARMLEVVFFIGVVAVYVDRAGTRTVVVVIGRTNEDQVGRDGDGQPKLERAREALLFHPVLLVWVIAKDVGGTTEGRDDGYVA